MMTAFERWQAAANLLAIQLHDYTLALGAERANILADLDLVGPKVTAKHLAVIDAQAAVVPELRLALLERRAVTGLALLFLIERETPGY